MTACGCCGKPRRKGGGQLWIERGGRLVCVLACRDCCKDSIRLRLAGSKACIECTRAAAVLCLACVVKHRARVKAAKEKRRHQRAPLVQYIREGVVRADEGRHHDGAPRGRS